MCLQQLDQKQSNSSVDGAINKPHFSVLGFRSFLVTISLALLTVLVFSQSLWSGNENVIIQAIFVLLASPSISELILAFIQPVNRLPSAPSSRVSVRILTGINLFDAVWATIIAVLFIALFANGEGWCPVGDAGPSPMKWPSAIDMAVIGGVIHLISYAVQVS